jgi:CBS domain-containing protein
MQLREIMTPGVECVRPNDSLAYAAQRMRDLNVGALPVCGMDDRLAGIVTDRDITVRAVAEARDPEATTVLEVMTPSIRYCFEDQELAEAANLMEDQQIRRLVVLNRNKRLVGIVSLGDVAIRSDDKRLGGEVLEQVSEPLAPVQ